MYRGLRNDFVVVDDIVVVVVDHQELLYKVLEIAFTKSLRKRFPKLWKRLYQSLGNDISKKLWK